MKIIWKTSFTFLLLSFGTFSLTAQQLNTSKAKIESCINSLRLNYLNSEQPNSKLDSLQSILDSVFNIKGSLQNGKIYTGYYGIEGSPFLFENIEGEITIYNRSYGPLKMSYDIYRDQLICIAEGSGKKNYSLIINNLKNYSLIINKLMVDNFRTDNMLFINFPHPYLGLSGFYELIYKGKDFSLIAKWTKSYSKDLSNIDLFSKPKRSLFFLNGEKSVQVKTKKEFTDFFGITKRELKTKLKFGFPNLSKASNIELSKLSVIFDTKQ